MDNTEGEVVTVTFLKPPGLKQVSDETLNLFWFKGINFIVDSVNCQFWLSEKLWLDGELRIDCEDSSFTVPLTITQLLETYQESLEEFLEKEYCEDWTSMMKKGAEKSREYGKKIFHEVFATCDKEILEHLIKYLTEALAETEEDCGDKKMENFELYLQKSIESISISSIFFMERISAQLLDRENSTWRDVSKFLIKYTIDAITELNFSAC